jgi:UDP-N-acetylmuramoyl-L-alanyl-D-glutamate--2,6-diaminopimelate ligase
VLHAGDPRAAELAETSAKAGSQVVTYGLQAEAQWRAEELELVPAGARFLLVSPHGEARVESKLAGEVNVLNLLGALAAAHARGVSFPALAAAIPSLAPVPGRFQPVDAGQPFAVIVDYAHTDDALRNLLRWQSSKRSFAWPHSYALWLRRRSRPHQAAEDGSGRGRASDFVVVTSDNPRSEDPLAIIDEILPGLRRQDALCRGAGSRAGDWPDSERGADGDVVLIAGKGHEKEQILRDRTIFFDDAQVALSALRAGLW